MYFLGSLQSSHTFPPYFALTRRTPVRHSFRSFHKEPLYLPREQPREDFLPTSGQPRQYAWKSRCTKLRVDDKCLATQFCFPKFSIPVSRVGGTSAEVQPPAYRGHYGETAKSTFEYRFYSKSLFSLTTHKCTLPSPTTTSTYDLRFTSLLFLTS